jgi:dTDP-4-dehydrorhamnose 3,5-epimerase
VRFKRLAIDGVWKVSLEPHEDERGFFARTFCGEEFAAHGLPSVFEQSSLSRNQKRGTLRGMHYQAPPHAEAKFVRCVAGAIFDVAVDIRPTSSTFGKWIGEALDSKEGAGLYIGAGLAHGFQTLADDSDVLYQITPAFRPGLGMGLRWDDPSFAIEWPIEAPLLSPRDAAYPNFEP